MVRIKSQKTVNLIILSIPVILLSILWVYLVVRTPVYGKFFPADGSPQDPTTELIFNGKRYKNISQTVIKKGAIIDLSGKSLGQIKAKAGDGPIVISSVYAHPDWLVVQDKVEMGFTAVFQEEK